MDKLLELVLALMGTKIGAASLLDADGQLKPDAFDIIKKEDAARVARIRKEGKDEGHGQAKRETLEAFEKAVKEKFGIDSDKTGIELIAQLLEEKGKPGEITDEQVTSHRLYLNLKEEQSKAVKEATKALQKQFDDFKTGVENEKVNTQVEKKALEIFDGLKPILSSDPAKAAKQKEIFVKQLLAGKYRIDGERIILLKEDGTDLVDEHGNRIDFTKHVTDVAGTYYDFEQAGGKGSPGGQSSGSGAGGAGGAKYVFKDVNDFSAKMAAEANMANRAEMTTAWEAQQKTNPKT